MFQTFTTKLTTIACGAGLLTAITVASGRAQDFRVEGAGLEAVPTSYRGPCPGMIKFAGKIQASAAGRVKYTFFRSDGGTGPEGFVDFEDRGVKLVETSWTLGGAALTHYEGWVAIRILSPNSYESNHAKFVLDCDTGKDKQPDTQPTPIRQDARAESYQKELPNLAATQKEKLEKEMASLKSLGEKLQPSLAAAQSKLGFDSTAIGAEFRAISEEPDAARRAQRAAEFQTKYEPEFIKLAQTAGIDMAAQRGQVITLLDLSNMQIKENKTLAIEVAEYPRPPATLRLAAPNITERSFGAPFTSAGATTGGVSLLVANASSGELGLNNALYVVGSNQQLAFISQTLNVEAGIQRVRVSVTLDPVSFQTMVGIFPCCYASSEAQVNFRVMEGARGVPLSAGSPIFVGDHVSLSRAVTVLGTGGTSGTRPVTLSGEFTRAHPDEATTYTLVAEIEGWAGVGGAGLAQVTLSATVRQFHVYLHRR